MDSQEPTRNVGPNNPLKVPAVNPPAVAVELRGQGSGTPPPSYFPGFPQHGAHMPFLYPHSYMSPRPGVGFPLPVHGFGGGIPEISATSPKRYSQEGAIDQPKTVKKRRVARKKPEIIELGDVKEEVETSKSGGHWKDHWVIQLITIRGEMHSIFSSPPNKVLCTIHNLLFIIFLHSTLITSYSQSHSPAQNTCNQSSHPCFITHPLLLAGLGLALSAFCFYLFRFLFLYFLMKTTGFRIRLVCRLLGFFPRSPNCWLWVKGSLLAVFFPRSTCCCCGSQGSAGSQHIFFCSRTSCCALGWSAVCRIFVFPPP